MEGPHVKLATLSKRRGRRPRAERKEMTAKCGAGRTEVISKKGNKFCRKRRGASGRISKANLIKQLQSRNIKYKFASGIKKGMPYGKATLLKKVRRVLNNDEWLALGRG